MGSTDPAGGAGQPKALSFFNITAGSYIDSAQMDKMMDTMMPMMMNMMQEKGIAPLEMMKKMCPKCISVASAWISEEEKTQLKSHMSEVFASL